MGTSVATELLARDIEGALDMELTGAVLFDGSMIIERASLTLGQKLLRSRLGPLLRPPLHRPLLPPAARLGLRRGPPDERRGGRRPVGADEVQRRQPHRRQADRLHLRTRPPRRALARRGPRLAQAALLRSGACRTRSPPPTSSTASASCAQRPPSSSSPTSPTTPRSKTPPPSTPPFREPFHPARLAPDGAVAQLVRAADS